VKYVGMIMINSKILRDYYVRILPFSGNTPPLIVA